MSAARSDQQADDPDKRLLVAMLGLAGEVGTLLSEHKKWLRDGDAHDRRTGVAEDVGDILWYLAAASSALGLSLDDVAEQNLAKVVDRWPPADPTRTDPLAVELPPPRLWDGSFPAEQQLPRKLTVALASLPNEPQRVIGIIDGERPLGNLLGDNAYDDDGYRWHDVIHLAHVAVLGWSPVIRALLKRKRKADPRVDDVEDGGRAVAVEEGISAAVFDYASTHAWLDNVRAVDTDLLVGVRNLTRNIEVGAVSLLEWEQTILRAFACWRRLRADDGGVISLDLDRRAITHRPLTDTERAEHAAAARVAIDDGLK
jgi:NTP pyrophosphatase (non-canonical NTP hydrolase)